MFLHNFNVPEQVYSWWFFDYNDLASQTVPIDVLANTETLLENDATWPYTRRDHKPVWIKNLYNPETNSMDFHELNIWDMVDMRLDLKIETLVNNTVVDCYLDVWQWTPSNFKSFFLTSTYFKAIWTYTINEMIWGYIWDKNIRDNPAKFYIKADQNIKVTVNWWYCKIIQKR